MATAKKLPSGSWRVQIFSHYEFVQQANGSVEKKRVYESFTCDDPSNRGKREAERMAAEYAATKERMSRTDYTLQEAMEKYIESKENLLSTTTLRGYKTLTRNAYPKLLPVRIRKLTASDIQEWANEYSISHSPKSVANAHGFISAVLNVYEPSLRLKHKTPRKEEYRALRAI